MPIKYAQTSATTVESNTALVSALAGRVLILKGVYFSGDTAAMLTLENSATNATILWRQYLAANGGSTTGFTEDSQLAKTISGEGIDFSIDTAGNYFLKVAYDVA